MIIFEKRFSLRSLLIVLCVIAMIASLPHLLISTGNRKAVLEISFERPVPVAESKTMEGGLSKENLCSLIRRPVREGLPCTVPEAITKVEIQREPADTPEGSHVKSLRLTLYFSDCLTQSNIKNFFGDIHTYVAGLVPAAKP